MTDKCDKPAAEDAARSAAEPAVAATPKPEKFPTAADILVIAVLFFVTQTVAAVLLSWFGLHLPDIADLQVEDIESYMRAQIFRGEGMAVVYPVSMTVSLAAIYLYIRFRGGKRRFARFSASGFNPNIILSGTIWVIAAQIVCEPLVAMLPTIENAGVGRGLWACVTAVVFAPIFEEILCRGLVLESVRRRRGNAVAVAVSALFFGLVHVEPSTALAGFVVGCIFGMIYVRTDSIFSTIILHSINNAIAFALICFGLDGVSFGEALGGGSVYYAVYGVAALLFVLFSVEAWRNVFRR